MIFAITDIETTGSHASGNSIIEIGVVLFDGERVVDEFHSLIDPGIPLPPFITKLTGIDDDMLKGAPPFHQIADALEEVMEGAVFVAHNVGFDFSFIRAEFAAIGRAWNPSRLCTMRLARKAYPGLRSYGLGHLCHFFEIENADAHRALSDARAALGVFRKSTEVLGQSGMESLLGRSVIEAQLPPHLNREEFLALPERPGVYYLLDEKGKAIYIGKAKNIKKRVKQHFTVNIESPKMQAFMREIHHVSFEETGSELLALLLEDAEIRKHWPAHNRAQKAPSKGAQVIQYMDQQGYMRLAAQTAKPSNCVRSFASMHAARNWLGELSRDHDLHPKLVGLSVFDVDAILPNADEHNQALKDALTHQEETLQNVFIESAGRTSEEKAYVAVVRGEIKGFAFLDESQNSLTHIQQNLRAIPSTPITASIIRTALDSSANRVFGALRIIPFSLDDWSD
ncbi:MAG: exonuclease domain-containing protein [Flavobacteriales bacterium]